MQKEEMKQDLLSECLHHLKLATVSRRTLQYSDWRLPDLADLKKSGLSPSQESLLAKAVNYEYAREFETLEALMARDRKEGKRFRPLGLKVFLENGKTGAHGHHGFDTEDHWHVYGATDRIDRLKISVVPAGSGSSSKQNASCQVWEIQNGLNSQRKCVTKERWGVDLDASPGFPERPFTPGEYADAKQTGDARGPAPGVVKIKDLQANEQISLPRESLPGYSYMVIAVDWRYSVKELEEVEFPRWIQKHAPVCRESNRGRALPVELTQALNDIAVLRLCCHYGSVHKARKETHCGGLYTKKVDWDRACLRAVVRLGQWGLWVRSVAKKVSDEMLELALCMAGKSKPGTTFLPLEIEAVKFALEILEPEPWTAEALRLWHH